MSSTTFGPVFSVGASCHPVETLDTWAESAGRAQRPWPGPLRPACAEKLALAPQPALSPIEIGPTARVEGLMRPLSVVEREIASNPHPGLSWRAIIGQVYFLILQSAPEPLGEDVISCPPLAIHSDLNRSGFERLREVRAGEMTALIGSPNQRESNRARLPKGIEHEWQFQASIQSPTHDIAREPSSTATRYSQLARRRTYVMSQPQM